MDVRDRVTALAAEFDRRYANREGMLGCPDGAGYYDLLADELRAAIAQDDTQ